MAFRTKGGVRKKHSRPVRSSQGVRGFFAQSYCPIMWILFPFVLMCAFGILYRLYHVQVVQGDKYRHRIDLQHKQLYSNDELVRGNIYLSHRDGSRLLAATNKDYYSLVINNKNLRNRLETQQALSKIVSFDNKKYQAIIAKKNDPYEILLKRISDAQAEQIRELALSGVELHVNEERHYPLGSLASAVIGFVSHQDSQWRGTYGLEKYYDNILRRDGEVSRPGIFSYLFGENEEHAQDESSIEKHIAKEGSLVATIEPNVQDFLQNLLSENSKTWNSRYSAGVIMDARSGKIVAMVSGNEFDLNTESVHYRNHLIEDRYEFGSVMKPLTVAMALDHGSINKDFSYNDTGSMTMDRHTFYNFDKRGRGAYTDLQTILTQSLNTGVATIALKMGFDAFEEYLTSLGLDSETGIDLPFEVYGITNNLDSRRRVELATASFGQGVAFTAIEMLQAWSALAHGGKIQNPYVVDMIEYGDLIPAKNVPPSFDQQVLSPDSVNQVTDMLVNLVDNSSTFKPYSLPQHSVALKTGTAQMVKPQGGYYKKRFLHAMMGYFPAKAQVEDQKYVIVLFTVQPQGARYSSTTLKEPFFKTIKYLVNYYNIKPDRNISGLDNIIE